jgi:hypothetical protein
MNMFSILLLGCTPTKTDTATQEVLENGLVDNIIPDTPFNKIQVFGTHNSYHVAPESTTVAEWNYTHDPLDIQLDKGIRQFEIDVVWDPEREVIAVQHVPVIDARSTCDLLLDCLAVITTWLDAHPNTVPLQILIEPKTEIATWAMTGHMDQLDDELRQGLVGRIWTVDDQWGEYETLRQSVVEGGFPTVGELRGKVLLALLDGGEPFDAYSREATEIRDRVMFPLMPSDHEWAGYFLRDNPYSEEIQDLHVQGFLVRTRADAGIVYDEYRWMTAYNGFANAISMDTEEGLSQLDGTHPVRILE